MKTIKLVTLLLLASTLSLWAQKSEIKIDESVVKWTGNKIGGEHDGEIEIKSGSFSFDNGNIISGTIVMDMKSITCADLEDEGYNQKLVAHLKSDDFFGVEKYPTSTFVVTTANAFANGKAKVSGDLTIKGKTENITFEVTRKGDKYQAQLKVNRSKYDVRYGSNSFFDNLGDKAIDDIFILDIEISL